MELLVVVIIIAILAAIALPNLLAQVGKSRNAEAQMGVGVLNNAQQIYCTENRAFAPALSDLNIVRPVTTYFTFSVTATGGTSVINSATANNPNGDGTKDQTGTVTYDPDTGAFSVTTSW
jgi:type II secretory pathway pseudopilin PulG